MCYAFRVVVSACGIYYLGCNVECGRVCLAFDECLLLSVVVV